MLSLAKQHKIAPRKRHVLPPGFWSRVDRSEGGDACWLWVKWRNKGYGTFMRGGKEHHAHRVALQWATQKEGRGLFATHGPCHNRACVNPAHLSWQSQKGNMADRLRDGTHNRGQRQGGSKLIEGQVLSIRADPRPYRQIATAYRISLTVVSNIKNRHRWGWLD